MTEAAADARARTMQVRALRRLSDTEVQGLGIALEVMERVEAELTKQLPELKRAAEREQRIRLARGHAPLGPAGRAWRAARQVMLALTDAREETSYVKENR